MDKKTSIALATVTLAWVTMILAIFGEYGGSDAETSVEIDTVLVRDTVHYTDTVWVYDTVWPGFE